MKYLLIALMCFVMCLFLLIPVISRAAGLQHESITVSDTAIGFTSSLITYPVFGATCTLETGQIRFWLDGTDPTSSEGHLLEIGQSIGLTNGVQIGNFRAIKTGVTSGVLRCSYE